MGVKVSVKGLTEAFEGAQADLAEDVTEAMRDASSLVKDDWRAAIRAAGLSSRLAYTIRDRTYPQTRSSLDPSGIIWSKAPDIMASLVETIVIRPTGGRWYLAIPTQNVPHKTARRLMTPVEVEASFNQGLIIRRGKGGNLLAYVNAIAGRSGRGYRAPTRGRIKQGRDSKLVLMFTLVKSVRTRKRLDLDTLAAKGAAHFDYALTRIMGARK